MNLFEYIEEQSVEWKVEIVSYILVVCLLYLQSIFPQWPIMLAAALAGLYLMLKKL